MRPTTLDQFRVNSPRPAYEANAHNVNEDALDCGIKAIKCCNTPRWRKLGTTKTFLTVLILLAIIQGISEKFITISAQQAALEHDYDPNTIEWLLVSNGIIQGIFAILIAYWGNRIHKITWLCGMIVFQSLTCLLIIFPTLAHPNGTSRDSTFNVHSVNLLCSQHSSASFTLAAIPQASTTLVGLFLLQTGLSYGFIAFYTLGLTYLDDNALEHNSPALIGGALAGRFLGIVLGNVLPILTYGVSLGWWLGWAILCPIFLIVATFIGLYPRRMVDTVVRQAADTIVETATNSSQLSLSRMKFLSDISFFSTMARVFRNKVLLLNIFATVFIQTALINFALQEQNYLQSRFLFPADESNILNNEWTSRTLTKFIQPFLVAMAILIGGLIIAKATPSPRKIVAWNLITALIVCLLFVGFIFIQCSHNSIAGAYGNKIALPYCSRNCVCDPDIRFTPVCPSNSTQTFFSPCHAGCESDQVVNASFGAVLVGSRFVGKIIISIRSVLLQDTAMALALELTFVGLIAYIPGKFAYEYIADSTCQFWSQNHTMCHLHSSQDFGNYVNILSAVLSFIAVIFEFIILFFVKDLELYGDRNDSEIPAVEMQPMSRPMTEIDSASQVAESSQPLLSQVNQPEPAVTRAGPSIISDPIIITSESTIPTHSPTVTAVRQTLLKRLAMSSHSSSVRYSPVYKAPDNHIEELNLRLQTLNQQQIYSNIVTKNGNGNGHVAGAIGDINPSVGSDTEKESELNIQQLESSVSSLSGLPSGSSLVHSPEISYKRRPIAQGWHADRYETDF